MRLPSGTFLLASMLLGLTSSGASSEALPASGDAHRGGAAGAPTPGAEEVARADPPAIPAEMEEAKSNLVDPFLARWKGKLGSARGVDSIRPGLRRILTDIERWALARHGELRDVPQRRSLARALREILVSGLAAELGGPGGDGAVRAAAVVSAAGDANRTARIEALYRGLMCWCPNEDWTRTLAGCTESCADEQKAMVQRGVDEGLSDEEIIQQMVNHPRGGPRVRAIPETTGTNLLGFVLPVVFFAVGVIVVIAALIGLSRHRGGPSPPLGKKLPETEEDRVWSERIEKELKEMET